MGRPLTGPWTGPLGAHQPGATWLHRMPPGLKLAALALVGVAVLLRTGPLVPGALLLVGVALVAAGRLSPRRTLRALVPVLVTAALVGGYQLWQRGAVLAAEVAGDLLAAVLLAVVLTATTPPDRLLDGLARVARPLHRFGVPQDAVALSVQLMLRAVPALAQTVHDSRDAARARGLERDPRALLVPVAVRAVGRARRTGDALSARGLLD